MELKYPKLSSGIKAIYVSWWFSFIGGVFGIACVFLTIFFFHALIGILLATVIGVVVEVVAYVLQIIGLYKASRDEDRYKKVFYMLLTELAFSVGMCIALIIKSNILFMVIGILGGLTCLVLEPLRLCLFVKYTEALVLENGDSRVKGYYKLLRNGMILLYAIAILAGIIMSINLLRLGALAEIATMLCTLAVFVLYAVFLHKTNKFFKTVEKPKPEESFLEFSAEDVSI